MLMAQEEERMPMIGAIRECGNRQLLEKMFDKFGVVDKSVKIEALKEAMYNPDIFFSGEPGTVDERYETLVGAFLSGVWKPDAL
jgi:hypothetical protein